MRPPPGRQRLSREFIARHQRARIVAALAEETMEKGYRAVTVADIVRRAGIARNTFYDNFSSKEDCFLATQDFAVEESLRRVVDAAAEEEGWEARPAARLGAFSPSVAGDPALPPPSAGDLPETLGETIIGGIFWVIYQRIVQGQKEQIETLLPDLVDFALTPYIGAESAQRATAHL